MSGEYLGDFTGTETIPIWFDTFDSNGASVTMTGLAVTDIEIYKGASMIQRASDSGYALIDTDGIDLDTVTGIHGFTVDLSDNTDAGFFAAGNDYIVVVSAVTIASQTVSFIAARFSIDNRGLLRPTTAQRKLDVTATGAAGIDWGNIENQATSVNLSSTTTNLCNTVTTNTDMRGTDNALLASSAPTNFSDLAITVTTGQVTVGTNNDKTGYTASTVTDKTGYSISGTKTTLDALNDLSTTQVGDAVWDESLSGHQTAGTAGRNLTFAGTILAETTLTGTPNTTTFQLTAGSATDNFYNDMEIVFASGNAAGLSRIISDYTGSTKTITVDEALPVTPTAADAVVIRTIHKHSRSQIATSVTADIDANSTQLAAIVADTNELQTDWANGGRLDLLVDQIITDIAALNNISAAQVNAEVLDVLNTDSFAEPTGVPAASAALATKIGYLYMALRNRVDVTSTKKTFYDDGGLAEWEKDLTDDGTTYSESEGNAI